MVFKNDCGKFDSVFKNTENLNVVFKNENLLQVVFKHGKFVELRRFDSLLGQDRRKNQQKKNTNLKTKLLESQDGRIDDYDLKVAWKN